MLLVFWLIPRRINKKALKLIGKDSDLKTYVQSVIDTIPSVDDPSTLDDFNYEYNDKGKLVNKTTGEPFHWINQSHYDALVPHLFIVCWLNSPRAM